MTDFDPISPQGQERKARILAVVLAAAASKRRRRIGLRVVAGVIPLVALATIVALKVLPPTPAVQPLVQIPSTTRAPRPSVAKRAIHIERIETDPKIADRLAAKPPANLVQRLTDDQLLSSLAQANRPAGLATVNNRTTLVFHDARAPAKSRPSDAPQF